MRAAQWRQRPRRSSHDATGTLSRAASCMPQLIQADAGFTTDRRSGTRAATTFRKLPSASPGAKANAATATSIRSLIGARRRMALAVPRALHHGDGDRSFVLLGAPAIT